MAIPKRLQLQMEHIRDLIKEQNRMLITEIEPTASERGDVLSLMDSIRKGVTSCATPVVNEITPAYTTILADLRELGYSVSPYELEKIARKPAKQVHFESDDGPLISGKTGEEDLTHHDQPERWSNTFSDDTYDEYHDSNNPSDSSGNTPYTDTPKGLTSAQLYQQNEYIYEDQDRRLEEISTSVNHQRQLGEGINSELDTHNGLLDDLEAQTERSQSRLDGLTHGVRNFNRKSRDCGVCSIILALLLILFILLLI